MTSPKLRALAAILAALALSITLAACGDDDDSDADSSEATTIAVPAAIKDKGKLLIATDAAYSPMEFVDEDGKTIIGADVDLGKALAEQLGLEVEFQNATFDTILAGVDSGKYDLSMSSFTDTKERQQQVDFVNYFVAGSSFFVRSDDGPDIQSLEDLCGRKVAVQKGTVQQEDAEAQEKKCDLELSTYPDQNGANQALASRRADVSIADSPVAAYQVKLSDGDFKLSGESYGDAPYGIALPKDSGLAEPFQQALQALIDNGRYLEILKQWGIEAGAVDKATINAGTE